MKKIILIILLFAFACLLDRQAFSQAEGLISALPRNPSENIIATQKHNLTDKVLIPDKSASENLKIKTLKPNRYGLKSLNDDLIEIGSEGLPAPQPYLKLNKWEQEVSLKVKIPYAVNENPQLKGGRLRYYSDKKIIELKWGQTLFN